MCLTDSRFAQDYGWRPHHMTRGLEWTYQQALLGNPTYLPYYNQTLDPDACARQPATF